ncbi:hypothetical protein YC2023_116481 [Brassica napus]
MIVKNISDEGDNTEENSDEEELAPATVSTEPEAHSVTVEASTRALLRLTVTESSLLWSDGETHSGTVEMGVGI